MSDNENSKPVNRATDWRNRSLAIWRRLPPVARVVLITLAAILLLVLLKPGAPTRPVDDLYARVHWEAAQPGSFSPELRLFGRIESPANATLTASVSAEVATTPVLPGNRVSAGELLLQLDPREAQLLLDQHQAELARATASRESARLGHRSNLQTRELEGELVALAEQQLQRLERLRTDNMASQAQLDEARQNLARARLSLTNRELAVRDHDNEMARLDAQIKRARALRDQAALDLERTAVTAPFAGRVANLHVAAGERVRPGEPLLTLYSDQGLEVRAQIPARFLPTVRDGLSQGPLKGHAILEGEQLPVKLERLAGLAGAGRGGIDGLFIIEDGDRLPEIGRNLELVLQLPPRDDLLALPVTAVHGLDRLYVIGDNNELHAVRASRAGEWRDSEGKRRLLLFSDQIRPGQRIMTTQLPGAIDGLIVAPVGIEPGSGEPDLPQDGEPGA